MREEHSQIPRVRVHTPLEGRLAAGIVCFEVDGSSPEAVVKRLHERRIIATASPYRVSYARVAAGIMVSQEEVEQTIRAVREAAA